MNKSKQRTPFSPITFQNKKISLHPKMSLENNIKPLLRSSSIPLSKQKNLRQLTSMDSYINQENQIDCSNQQWIESNQILPDTPFMYPLDPNHIIITGLSPSVIARNIRECLRKLSITVIFDKRNVSNTSNCYEIKKKFQN